MNKTQLIIYLINEQKIEFDEDWFLKEDFLRKMNDGNSNILYGDYIIPKLSINYIEFRSVKDENKAPKKNKI